MKRFQFSASIVCGNMLNLEHDVKAIQESGCEYIHFDVMDGAFVPRFGLLPEMLAAIKKATTLPVDVHLMVNEPEQYIKAFTDIGADVVTVHAEACVHLHRTLAAVRSAGSKVGLALNPATPISALDDLLEEVDLVLLMAINPGIVGHKLIPSTLSKIQRLKNYLTERNRSPIIQIDGGVTPESASQMVKVGADLLVCGSSTIFKPGKSIPELARALREKINSEISN